MDGKKPNKTKVHTVYKTEDGSRVPSVTTILGILDKPALLKWAWRCGMDGIDYKALRDNKADIGSLAHYLIMCHLKGEKSDTSEYSSQDIQLAENCFLSFLEWERHNKIKPVLIEEPLVSQSLRFGGTIDCFAELNDDFVLIDFKTGKAIYPEMIYQLSAYKMLLESNGYEVNQSRILRIGRDENEGFEERVIANTDTGFQLFLHCQCIYELQKQIRREK